MACAPKFESASSRLGVFVSSKATRGFSSMGFECQKTESLGYRVNDSKRGCGIPLFSHRRTGRHGLTSLSFYLLSPHVDDVRHRQTRCRLTTTSSPMRTSRRTGKVLPAPAACAPGSTRPAVRKADGECFTGEIARSRYWFSARTAAPVGVRRLFDEARRRVVSTSSTHCVRLTRVVVSASTSLPVAVLDGPISRRFLIF